MGFKLTNLLRRRGVGRKSLCGFTISEVIVASALLISAMIPILRGLTGAHLNSSRIAKRSHSLTLAQTKLDDIRARTIYDYLASYTEVNTVLDGAYLCDVADTALTADLRRIAVEVGFDENGNGVLDANEVQVLLDTLVARRI